MGSLINAIFYYPSSIAAERIEVQFEEMSIPISINELNDWTKAKSETDSELATWLNLLGFEGKAGLAKFLEEPFSNDREAALMLLRSWFGRKLFENFKNIIYLDDRTTDGEVINFLEEFLKTSEELTVLNFFKYVPAEVIHLNLDVMVKMANKLRNDLKKQQKLVLDLRDIPYKKENVFNQEIYEGLVRESIFEVIPLSVSHRDIPLNIEIWRPSKESSEIKSLIVFMPGLGGDQAHFRWLARSLSHNGWPVILLEHPGSDSQSIRSLLEGKVPAPGVEVIPDRLADMYSVFNALDQGQININSENIILMGHSLGAFIAFLASGAELNPSLNSICNQTFDNLSLANLSELLQCQLVDSSFSKNRNIPSLKAIVGLNSFGSLLWPVDSKINLKVPIFLTGGTFDLVTPAISEQLELFLATKSNSFSRVLLVEGASHFSPIRVRDQKNNYIGDDVFKLGESLVGFHPLTIQSLLAQEIIRFLDNLENEIEVPANTNLVQDNVLYHILDRKMIRKLVEN